MIYGKPQLLIDSDSSDKIGIRTLIASMMWQPSQEGLSLAEIDAQRPGVPSVSGGVLLVGNETRRNGGAYKTSWTFEGIDGDGKSVTFKDRSNSLDYSFEPGLSQVSLQLWMGKGGGDDTALQDLLTRYQGSFDPDNGQIIWPATLAAGSNTGVNGLAGPGASQAGQTNPMFGIQDFFRMEGTYRFRYAALTISADLYKGAGLVAGQLPGKPPAVADGRNWLKVPPTWRRRGLVFDITEEYWLSGIGGWPAPIYGSGSGSSGNLLTGNLSPQSDNAQSLGLLT